MVYSQELTEWLKQEAERRGWSFREIARRGGLSSGAISNVMTGNALAGWDLCVGIAQALDVAPEVVFRKAGLLPSLPPAVEQEQEVVGILRNLPADVQRTVITMLRSLTGEQPISALDPEPVEGAAAAEARVAYSTMSDLERQLLDEFRRLDPAWQRIALEEVERLGEYQVRISGDEDETQTEEETQAT
jgi:transcriptional regulator with XRE-family HTH domain